MPSIRLIPTSGSKPTTTQIGLGDIVVNTYDGKAYTKKQVGINQSIVEIGSGVVPATASYALTASYLDGFVTSASYAATASYATNFQVSGSIFDVNYIDFDTTVTGIQPSLARLSWNSTDKTLEIGTGDGDTALQIGQETVYPPIVNKDSIDLGEGTLVMVNPSGIAQGNRISVVRAVTDGTYPSQYIVGVLTEDIAKNQEGFAAWFGYVRNLNIPTLESNGIKPAGETWIEGNVLFPNPSVPGGYTITQPQAPAIDATIAVITAINGNNLTLLVRPTLTLNVGELNNVTDTTTSSSYGDLFIKSGSVWITGRQLTGSYGLTGSLAATSFTGSLLGTASFSSTSSFPWTLTGSSIFYNNGNVGIGTNNPYQSLLTLSKSGSNTMVQLVNASEPAFNFRIHNSGSVSLNSPVFVHSLNYGDNRNSYIAFNRGGAGTDGYLTFGDYGGERMRIAYGGNVLIGTTINSTYKLDVSGNVKLNGNTYTTGNAGIGVETPTSRVQIKGSGTTNSTTALRVENANSTASLVVLDNGNVGIGTNTPTSKLDIIGTSKITTTTYGLNTGSFLLSNGDGDTRNSALFLGNTSDYNPASNTNTISASIAGIKFDWYNDNWRISATRGGGTSIKGLVFSRNNTEHMVIDSNGSVGIGTTTNSTYKLDVRGDVQISGSLTSMDVKDRIKKYTILPGGYIETNPINFRFDESATAYAGEYGTITFTGGTPPNDDQLKQFFTFTQNWTNLFSHKDASNNLSIELSNIALNNSANTSWKPYVFFHSSGTNVTNLIIELKDGANNWATYYNGPCSDFVMNEFYIIPVGILRGVRYTFNGIVGNSYLRMLGVIGKTVMPYAWSLLRSGGDIYGNISIISGSTTQAKIEKNTGNLLALGNVSIGTTSQSGKVHILSNTTAGTSTNLYLENNGDGGSEGVSIKFDPMFGATTMIASNREGAVSNKSNLTFHTYSSSMQERMRITADGYVGIGNTNPNVALDLSGELAIRGGEAADDARIYFRASDNSNRMQITTDLDSNPSNDKLILRSNSINSILVIKGDGKVTIGDVASPTEKLEVVGNIKATAITSSFIKSILANGETSNLNLAWTASGTSISNGLEIYRYLSSATNTPVTINNANWMLNLFSHPAGGVSSYGHQLAAADSENIYFRKVSNGTFGSWLTLYHTGNLTNLNQLTNGPGYIGSSQTSSFATTGSNIFKGNQTITGSTEITGSLNVIGTLRTTGSIIVDNGAVGIVSTGTTNASEAFKVQNATPDNLLTIKDDGELNINTTRYSLNGVLENNGGVIQEIQGWSGNININTTPPISITVQNGIITNVI